MKILGMGNALVDVLAQISDDKLLNSLELPKGAMTLIDENKFEKLSEELQKLNPSIVSGGSASNTVVGLASLGLHTGFIGRIGNDSYGKIYKEDLEKYQVCPQLIEVEEVSGVASTFISPDGERTFGTYLGAAALLEANNLSIDDFLGYDLFYIEGYLVQSHTLIEKAVQLAKEAGLLVAIDMASYNVVEANKDFLSRIVPQYIDIVFANEEEAKAMTGLEPEQAVSVIAEQVGLAIVKAGSKGSWIQQQGCEKINITANKVNCLDATGAGDLYAAGFIYGLAYEKDLTSCAKIGTLLASEVIQVIGPKIPDDRWKYIKQKIETL